MPNIADGRERPQLNIDWWAAALLMVALGLGFFAATGNPLPLLLMSLPMVKPFARVPPFYMVTAAAVAPWVVRFLSVYGGLPKAIESVDLPLALVAFIMAASWRRRRPSGMKTGQIPLACGFFAGACLLSGIYVGANPTRTLAGLGLIILPFLLVLATVFAPPTDRQKKFVIRLLMGIAVMQVPFGMVQRITAGHGDAVVGTLLNARAGHHVMSSFLLLMALVSISYSGRAVRWIAVIGALGMAVIADAKAPLFVTPVGTLVYFVWARLKSPLMSTGGYRWVGAVFGISVVSLVVIMYPASKTGLGYLEETVAGNRGKSVVLRMLVEDFSGSVGAIPLGFGPGNTVTRFATLTGPAADAQSLAKVLQLRPGSKTGQYMAAATGGTDPGATSSVLSATSSLLGILGDYGVLGAMTFIWLLAAVGSGLLRSDDPLAGAALAALVCAVLLGLAYDWLEQPPFMASWALIAGMALRPGRKGLPSNKEARRANSVIRLGP